MTASLRFYALGLRLGIVDISEVQSWVNSVISKTDNPTDEILDLAYASSKILKDVYSLLTRIPDDTDHFELLRILLGRVSDDDLEDIGFCRHLAKKLYDLWAESDYSAPEDLQSMGLFDDEYILAEQENYGILEEWHVNFHHFVKEFR